MSEPPLQLAAEDLALVRGILEAHLPGREVWAFGSRVQGRARPYMDAFSESELPFRGDLVEGAEVDDGFRRIIEAQRRPLPTS